jgi:hypothetical protein
MHQMWPLNIIIIIIIHALLPTDCHTSFPQIREADPPTQTQPIPTQLNINHNTHSELKDHAMASDIRLKPHKTKLPQPYPSHKNAAPNDTNTHTHTLQAHTLTTSPPFLPPSFPSVSPSALPHTHHKKDRRTQMPSLRLT